MKKIEEMIAVNMDRERENSMDLLSTLKLHRKRVLSFRYIRASFRDWRE